MAAALVGSTPAHPTRTCQGGPYPGLSDPSSSPLRPLTLPPPSRDRHDVLVCFEESLLHMNGFAPTSSVVAPLARRTLAPAGWFRALDPDSSSRPRPLQQSPTPAPARPVQQSAPPPAIPDPGPCPLHARPVTRAPDPWGPTGPSSGPNPTSSPQSLQQSPTP